MYATSSAVISAKPFVSLAVSLSGELSRKKKEECSDLSSGISKDEI